MFRLLPALSLNALPISIFIARSLLRPAFTLGALVFTLAWFTPVQKMEGADGGLPGRNTAEGDFALNGNTTGMDDTAIGYSALLSNSTGRFNTASGSYALQSNTTGELNTASGLSRVV